MTDQELADAIVALGVGVKGGPIAYSYSQLAFDFCAPDRFVRDPRVAMAMMEKVDGQEILIWCQHYEEGPDAQWVIELGDSPRGSPSDGRNESLPRAINEAAVKALT